MPYATPTHPHTPTPRPPLSLHQAARDEVLQGCVSSTAPRPSTPVVSAAALEELVGVCGMVGWVGGIGGNVWWLCGTTSLSSDGDQPVYLTTSWPEPSM